MLAELIYLLNVCEIQGIVVDAHWKETVYQHNVIVQAGRDDVFYQRLSTSNEEELTCRPPICCNGIILFYMDARNKLI